LPDARPEGAFPLPIFYPYLSADPADHQIAVQQMAFEFC
jgi:hypothetical protein